MCEWLISTWENARHHWSLSSVQSLSRVWLCDPMNCSTPGLPVRHQFSHWDTSAHMGYNQNIRRWVLARIPPQDVYPSKMKTHKTQHTNTPSSTAAPNWKQFECPDDVVDPYNWIKRNGVLIHGRILWTSSCKWKNPVIKGHILYAIPFVWNIQNGQVYRDMK